MDNIFLNPGRDHWVRLIKRPGAGSPDLVKTVSKILLEVKEDGDAALSKYSLKFDGLTPGAWAVSAEEIEASEKEISQELKDALTIAKANIEKFHAAQAPKKETKIETRPGVICWRKNVPIENVGLYIPGGTAPLFSTLLMLGIPAKIAGCKNIIVCTPAGSDGKIHPAILFVAKMLGLKNIYKAGGAQAIAAMAYGTESIPKIDKIFGPGNSFVTCAKKLVSMEGTTIDMLAGPSELAVYADETCIPAFVAADLLSQSEHGIDSQVMLVATKMEVIEDVVDEINRQLPLLKRREIINQSLVNSRFILMENKLAAFDLLNAYAPEHLIIASEKSKKLSASVINAGSVFLGNYSSESSGDYASGTNHSLPTSGTANTYSGVSVDSFVKKITFQKINKKGLQNIGAAVETMAAAEGLGAHKNAITIRLQKQNDELI